MTDVVRIMPGDFVRCVTSSALYKTFDRPRGSQWFWPYTDALNDVRRNDVFLVVAAISYPEPLDNRGAFELHPDDEEFRYVQALLLSSGHDFGWSYGEYYETIT